MAKVSVVIPCFDQGAFLDEAIESVLAQTYRDLEIIVVNDGSTDKKTIDLLSDYKKDKTVVITTDNQGLAAARNNGIKKARGTYILPLDADDKITPEYVEQAVAVLERESDVGIVYCRAKLFGAINTEWNLPEYSIGEMLKDNLIFCTALYRRSDWEEVGGYDSGMIYGWEDYDFWLSLIERGRKVRQLNDYCFYYRVASDSMVRSKEKWQKIEMFKRIFQRHQDLFSENIEIWLSELIDLREKYYLSRLYVDCGKGFIGKNSVALKIDPGTRTLCFDIENFTDRKAIRYDPVDCPVCIKVNSVELIGNDFREKIDIQRISSNALYCLEDLMMFDGDDPQILLKCSEEKISCASKVIIELDFRSIGENALRDIVIFQKGDNNSNILKKFLTHWVAGRK